MFVKLRFDYNSNVKLRLDYIIATNFSLFFNLTLGWLLIFDNRCFSM